MHTDSYSIITLLGLCHFTSSYPFFLNPIMCSKVYIVGWCITKNITCCVLIKCAYVVCDYLQHEILIATRLKTFNSFREFHKPVAVVELVQFIVFSNYRLMTFTYYYQFSWISTNLGACSIHKYLFNVCTVLWLCTWIVTNLSHEPCILCMITRGYL